MRECEGPCLEGEILSHLLFLLERYGRTEVGVFGFGIDLHGVWAMTEGLYI